MTPLEQLRYVAHQLRDRAAEQRVHGLFPTPRKLEEWADAIEWAAAQIEQGQWRGGAGDGP